MRSVDLRLLWLCCGLCAVASLALKAQEARPEAAATQPPPATLAVDAKLVTVPAVVFDKKGLVSTLTKGDFAITVDGKPQTVRYFDHDNDVPLTVGLLVDVSRSQMGVLGEEQRASQTFLDSFLNPGAAGRPADKAFILQFAHGAELLQDVTDSHPLLAAGLKEIGTQAPGRADEDASTTSTQGNNDPNAKGNGGGNGNGNGNGGGYGGYGRRSGYPGSGNGNGSGGTQSHESHASGGTVLYDSLFLAADDVLSRQKGRRALVVLTDGVDRHSKESLKEAIEAAQRADAIVYAIYYKGNDGPHEWNGNRGNGGYGGYDPYGRYPPTTGGSTDPGTYKDPDGRKILEQICSQTGGRMFQVKGKGGIESIYGQIGDELRAQYRLGFTPSQEVTGPGYHAIQLTLTEAAGKKLDIQTRDGFYLGAAKAQ